MSILQEVSLRSGLSVQEIKIVLKKKEMSSYNIRIPVCIINHPTLGPLEAIVKYLKEEKGLRFSQIAILTGRDQRAIGVTYHAAILKEKGKLVVTTQQPTFPVQLLQNKELSVLEHIVTYILNEYCMRLCDIAKLTGKDDRTIWTIRKRAQIKM